jgi:lysophospholipase L1-like esterase
MRTPIAACFAVLSLVVALVVAGAAFAAERHACEIPGYLLFGGNELNRVRAAVTKDHRLTIAVVGTGSSILAGPDGPPSAYPARLEAALKQRLPSVAVKVVTLVRTRQTTGDLAQGMGKLLIDEKPDLVVWQTGTVDAIRRVDPDNFRAALDEGVETLNKGGADVILMNMQYSPRTDTMIALGPYADAMRVVAQQHEVPLFDRLAIMRHWSDTGAFDLYAAGRDNVLAHRVHDCIGRGIAATIIDAAHLKAGQ